MIWRGYVAGTMKNLPKSFLYHLQYMSCSHLYKIERILFLSRDLTWPESWKLSSAWILRTGTTSQRDSKSRTLIYLQTFEV